MPVLKWLVENWVKIALTIATAVYLPFAFELIQDAGSCAPAIASDHPYWEFYYRFLACRPINEIGDTFAGFFAPLAFIWLAGAVYIQSQELAAQRRELDETQGVMREQLAVAREQVVETKATTALLKEQGEAINDERRRQAEREADGAFDAIKENFFKAANDIGAQHLVFNHVGLPSLAFEHPYGIATNSRNTFDTCIADLKKQTHAIWMARQALSMELADCNIDALQGIKWGLERMSAHLPKTSLATQIRAESYELPALESCINQMIREYRSIKSRSKQDHH